MSQVTGFKGYHVPLASGGEPGMKLCQNLMPLSSLLQITLTLHKYWPTLLFQIYMYCVWNGWIIQLLLFIAVLKLTLNYLYIRYIQVRVYVYCHCTGNKDTLIYIPDRQFDVQITQARRERTSGPC